MTIPNPARDARPGARFTDPAPAPLDLQAVGEWLIAEAKAKLRREREHVAALEKALWATGRVASISTRYRTFTKVECEVELRDTAPLEQWKRDVLSAAEVCATDEPGPHIVETGGYRLRIDRADYPTVPALLDPGNPEHLRAHAAASYRLAALLPGTQDGETLETAAGIAEWRAERLDREQREAEQEDADRKRAEEIAREQTESDPLFAPTRSWEDVAQHVRDRRIALALAGIRAGRAERQEAGQ